MLERPGEGLCEQVWDSAGPGTADLGPPTTWVSAEGTYRAPPFPVAVKRGVGYKVPAEDR